MQSWTITWRGHQWTEADLTGEHLATLAIISGDDRFEMLAVSEDEVREYPSLGFMRLMNLIATFATVTACDGVDDETANVVAVEALTQVQKASAEEIIGALSFDQLVTA